MYHFFSRDGADKNGIITITGQDAVHIATVLRMRPGDRLVVSDGADNDYYCIIVTADRNAVTVRAGGRFEPAELVSEIILFQGMPKAGKLEFIIQKNTELGVSRIVPVMMKRCVARPDKSRLENRLQRWRGVAQSAAKQCGRSKIPEIARPLSVKEVCGELKDFDIALMPYECASGMIGTLKALGRIGNGQRIAIIIGPEGGFEKEEAEMFEKAGALPISLGRRILRTETAGMVTAAWCMLRLEQIGTGADGGIWDD